jgi:hypothetical protein
MKAAAALSIEARYVSRCCMPVPQTHISAPHTAPHCHRAPQPPLDGAQSACRKAAAALSIQLPQQCRLERNLLTPMLCATAARCPQNRHWTPQHGATAATAILSTGPQADKYNHPTAAFTPTR